MKKFITLISLTFCILFSKAQGRIAYYDAVQLKNYCDHHSGKIQLDPQLKVLYNYYFDPSLNDSMLKIAIKANPFLNDFFVSGGGIQGGATSPISSFFGQVGNMDVTNFADGLAKFLVARAKDELNVAFFRKLQEFIGKYPEVKMLFPNTVGFISSVAVYKYATILPALTAAFQKDFNAMGSNLLKFRVASNYPGYDSVPSIKKRADSIVNFLNNTIAGRSIMAAVVGMNDVIKGYNPVIVISDVAGDQSCDPSTHNDNLSNSVQFVNMFSQSLRSSDSGRAWITKQEVLTLTNDPTTLKLYFGLLYAVDQKSSHKIVFNDAANLVTLQSILTKLHTAWATVDGLNFINTFKSTANSVSEASDNALVISTASNKSRTPSFLQYADYTTSFSNLVKLTTSLLNSNAALNPFSPTILKDLEKFTTLLNDAMNSCYDIESQNYGALVLHTSTLIGDVVNNQNYSFKSNYVKYGSFMASIVSAKNSDDVAAAFDAAVLPAGSSSIKRETYFNISLNAYLGIFGGAEYLPTLRKNATAFSLGVTAPVGVAFSWGNKMCGSKTLKNGNPKGGKSLTLFIPLIDVGALAAFRLNNDSTNVASTVQLKNIIAPGLYFYYGLGKCPISIGIGGQYGPLLRGVNVAPSEMNVNNNYYLRFAINVVVDMPFLNFYTKTDKSD
jgi:hypothetical protein